jgi:hypothetical protein
MSSWLVVTAGVTLVFTIIITILLACAVQPLRHTQKKGWVLLFATWLVSGIETVVSLGTVARPSLICCRNLVWGNLAGYHWLLLVRNAFWFCTSASREKTAVKKAT